MPIPIPSPIEVLQRLIQFNTTNPPGNEQACITYIRDLLAGVGIESQLLALTPERPNLVARLKGTGSAPPLMLYGHIDVVTTAGQTWLHPPFGGEIVDGWIWGRGALDMKGPLTVLLYPLLMAKAQGVSLPGDVIFSAMVDEEVDGKFGAQFLVNQHPEQFQGLQYALSEFGGFNMAMAGQRLYPIQISEKQVCALKATFIGRGGHGSMPVHGQAMARLGSALQRLDQSALPVHISPPVRLMIGQMAAALPGPTGLVLRGLLNPTLAGPLLSLLGSRGALLNPLLRNTASPTMLAASDKLNVIPSEVQLGIDGRLVPGGKPEQLIAELGALLGAEVKLEVARYDPGPAAPEMGLFDRLGQTLRDLDPQARPVPYVGAGVTDARYFSRLGIQTYGFTPLRLPDDLSMAGLIHAADERLPVDALDFGVQAVYRLLTTFSQP